MPDSTIRTIKHSKSNGILEVHPYGATVLKWGDTLFVSETALLDGTKPVRGGIPLVFPVFGPTGTSMPQHGYARRNLWTFCDSYDNQESAGVSFELKLQDVEHGRGEDSVWARETTKYNCTLHLAVDFTSTTLRTTMTVHNTGSNAFPVEALLHTYYNVHGHAAYDTNACYVKGLQGYTKADKVTNDPLVTTDETPVTIQGEVDRVYTPPQNTDIVNVTIGVGIDVAGNKKTVNLKSEGNIDGISVPVSCVVWNPGPEKANGMSDFSDSQYTDMICVEPGIIGKVRELQPNKRASLSQCITL